MTERRVETFELITIPAKWDFEYRYFAGATASRFFGEIQRNGRIFGARCGSCGKVLVPARAFCEACYVATDEWIEVGPGGVLDVFTIVATKFPGLPDPPFVMGYVTLDGGDTAILNHVHVAGLEDVDLAAKRLMGRPRVIARFSDQREGRITDFYFELEKPL